MGELLTQSTASGIPDRSDYSVPKVQAGFELHFFIRCWPAIGWRRMQFWGQTPEIICR